MCSACLSDTLVKQPKRIGRNHSRNRPAHLDLFREIERRFPSLPEIPLHVSQRDHIYLVR